jgi:hypothetical protein
MPITSVGILKILGTRTLKEELHTGSKGEEPQSLVPMMPN